MRYAMNRKFEILLKQGMLVDPANRMNGRFDLAIKDGRIAKVAQEIDESTADRTIDLKGLFIVPGIIDIHIHASQWLGGKYSHYMMAKAGVTTALDMAGPIEGALDIARQYGAGLNLACLQYLRPDHTISGKDPTTDELKDMMTRCMSQGALGVKILGGHYPVTPEAAARTIAVAEELNAYVAFHAGTTKKGSDILGMAEAVDLAQGRRLHLVHINSYCRGQVDGVMDEVKQAVSLLEKNPKIISESYLSPINGTSAKCSHGVPESLVTSKCLQLGGYEPTESGMEQAIIQGWGQINMETDEEVKLAWGESAAAYWRQRQTDATVSFHVNPLESRLILAAAKRESGAFTIDCLGTDGGGIPRNTTVAMGLALVKLGALTLEEFVIKTSLNPASILGLPEKGHLEPGADADITVVDLDRGECHMSMAGGRIIMDQGRLTGSGTTIITSPEGEEAVKAKGFKTKTTRSGLMVLNRPGTRAGGN
jgi:cytosine/adenosine deaminase-related metal-dependent hydrolase